MQLTIQFINMWIFFFYVLHMNIPLWRTTIICMHSFSSLLLITYSMTWIFWWKRSLCSSLTAPKFSGKKSKFASKKLILRDKFLPYVCVIVIIHQQYHNVWEIYDFQKCFAQYFEMSFTLTIRICLTFFYSSPMNVLIWEPTKISSRNWGSLTGRNLS